MALAEEILKQLTLSAEGLDDDQLARHLGVRRQAVNQACRALANGGQIARGATAGTKILNRITDIPIAVSQPTLKLSVPGRTDRLGEDEVKTAMLHYLESLGWEVAVAWGHARGADIIANKGSDRLVIEAKGEVALQPQQVNYFVGALGELVQRMDRPEARYGLALPDNRQYRRLVERLPTFAWHAMNLVCFFVSRSGSGYLVADVGFSSK